MQILQEGNHTAEFLLSEGQGQISREQGVLAPTAAALPSGQVLARNADGKFEPFNEADVATQPAEAVLYGAVPASAVDQPISYVARLAEVAQARLTGYTAAAKAGLASKNIIVR